jgi:transposase
MRAIEALSLIAGHVSEEILLRNEYLAAENEILRSKLGARVPLTHPERLRLAKLGKKLGKKALKGLSAIVKPETILQWYRQLFAKKFDRSKNRKKPGRPRVDETTLKLVLRIVEENPRWGYDRIAGALDNLGHKISDETVGNILRRHGISPAPRRKPEISWTDFIKAHEDVLTACDFFTVEVFTKAGLITYFVLFFIKIGSRDVHIASVTPHPNEAWMKQIARNATMDEWDSFTDNAS